MPSTLGAMLTSDAPSASGSKKAPRTPNGRNAQRSSPRPYEPPSESNGALSDGEGFPDDEVVGVRGTDRNRPRDPMAQAVPKVVDRVGEKVAEEFEKFLDQLAVTQLGSDNRKLIGLDTSKMSFRPEHLLRAPCLQTNTT